MSDCAVCGHPGLCNCAVARLIASPEDRRDAERRFRRLMRWSRSCVVGPVQKLEMMWRWDRSRANA